MQQEMYKGVTIRVYPGVPGRKLGKFVLSWPGHAPEEMLSTRYQAPYVLEEAKGFVDDWIGQGYITGGQVSEPDGIEESLRRAQNMNNI
jgi:hypothetical protein